MALTVQHVFKRVDDEKSGLQGEAIVVLGSTGCGKSSLIKLFCDDNVAVSHSTKSCTKKSKLYKDKACNRYWLDSQGANDSDGDDDEKVLKDILKTLYDKKVGSIKAIWCISGDFDRERYDLVKQAAFIKCLGDKVWGSCLIIQKGGPLVPDVIDGALDAAKNKGSNMKYGDCRLLGFTGLGYNGNKLKKNMALKMIEKFTKPNTKERHDALKEGGFLTNQQIINTVNGKLNGLAGLKLKFDIMQCTQCGCKGDPRFIFKDCHVSYTYTHSGSCNCARYKTEWYHSSSGLHYNFFKHGDTEWRHDCCYKMEYKYKNNGCTSRQVVDYYVYSCCNNSSGSSGCTKVCRSCDRKWGGSEGCTKPNKEPIIPK